jgi:hypothetical protein
MYEFNKKGLIVRSEIGDTQSTFGLQHTSKVPSRQGFRSARIIQLAPYANSPSFIHNSNGSVSQFKSADIESG